MHGSAFLGSASAIASQGGPVFARRCFCVRKRLQPFATVCNRPPCASCVRRAMAETLTFGAFKRCVTSFHVAGVAPCDIPACITPGVFSDRCNTFGRFFFWKTCRILCSAVLDGLSFLIPRVGEYDAAQSCWMGFGFWRKENCL